MKRLPKVNKGFGDKKETVREYLQKKRDANKIPHHLSEYLCEREIYTPQNYDKVRDMYSGFITEHKDEINSSCVTHNEKTFKDFFNSILKITNDWVTSRMVIHCCIQEFSLVSGMVSVFEWADDIMIDHLHSSSATNR